MVHIYKQEHIMIFDEEDSIEPPSIPVAPPWLNASNRAAHTIKEKYIYIYFKERQCGERNIPCLCWI